MKLKIESLAHWISISCMAGAVGMVCAGQTVLQPALHTGGEWVSLLYWSVCAASVISTATFAYLALAGAQQRLRTVTTTANPLPASAAAVRFSLPEKQLAEV
jgi:hypothetical protein